MELTINISDKVAKALEAEAKQRRLSVEEVAAERVEGGKDLLVQSTAPGYYESLWGAGKGLPGSFGSKEAADKYLEEERNSW